MGFRLLSVGFRVLSFGFRGDFEGKGVGFRDLGPEVYRVVGFGCRVYGFRVSGPRFWV